MDFLRVELQAPADKLDSLYEFYARELELEQTNAKRVHIGVTELSFRAGDGNPFYHFALLVPGDRFDSAREWIAERTSILSGGDIDGVAFDFDNWNALALYFHDPAGNIVELIAHRGIEENGRKGSFRPSELRGFSELGLVGDQNALAQGFEQLGIPMWDGELSAGQLAFFGERARTFIVSPPGRGWLPTSRAAEAHRVEVTVRGPTDVSAQLGSHRINLAQAELNVRSPPRSVPGT